MLEFCIPEYQAVLGVVLIFGLVFVLRHVPVPFGKREVGAQEHAGDAVIQQASILDNPDMIGYQKIGTTIREDSVLSRFVMKVM